MRKGEDILKCRICRGGAIDTYCQLHEKANRNIVENYIVWKKALNISWKEYLNEIAKNPYTGSAAKELAEHLMRRGE